MPYRAYVDVTKAKLLRASSGAGHAHGVVCGPIAARIEHSAYDTDSAVRYRQSSQFLRPAKNSHTYELHVISITVFHFPVTSKKLACALWLHTHTGYSTGGLEPREVHHMTPSIIVTIQSTAFLNNFN
jgi:hypothetical protein